MKKYLIRPIELKDSAGVGQLIRTVMPEFGASGPGFAINDPEVDDMYGTYTQKGHAYFVVVEGDKVLGGGGIAPLLGGDPSVCELRKMYFMPALRGQGLGQAVMDLCLKAAKELGYKNCYLETLVSMEKARALYKRNGFEALCSPMGSTGHFSCDSWFLKKL